MKLLPLPALAVGGLLALAAAFLTEAQGGNLFSNPERLIGAVMAEDRADLAGRMEVLEPALDDARDAMYQAELDLQQSEIDAAGILVTFLNAEAAGRHARKVFADAARRLANANNELGHFQAQSRSQENNAEIAGLKAEIATFQATVASLKTDLIAAEADFRNARTEVSDSETSITDAKTMLDEARDTVATVWAEIDTDQQALYRERKDVDSLVAHLTKEQLSALNRSLGDAVAREPRIDIDAEHLRTILDNDYNRRQIALLTQALEAEAKFLRIAAKTGNTSFLAMAERAKQPFLAKIDYIEAEKFDAYMGGNSVLQTASGPGGKQTKKPAAPIAEDKATGTNRLKPHDFVRGMLGLH